MQDLFGEAPEPPVRKRNGEWRSIASAPLDRPVDLWIAAYEYEGVLAENCLWNAEAPIPDWYRADDDGEPVVAVKPIYHATHWKPAGAPEGPGEDGGPPIGARTSIGDFVEHWPAEMRARYEAYRDAPTPAPTVGASLSERLAPALSVIQGGRQ